MLKYNSECGFVISWGQIIYIIPRPSIFTMKNHVSLSTSLSWESNRRSLYLVTLSSTVSEQWMTDGLKWLLKV